MAVTKTYLTEAGARVAAYCQMNNIPLVFKYFILSDGLNYDPAQATALIGTLQSKVNITRIKRLSPNSYLLRGEWRNDQIEQMLPYRELGLFCINPENEDEVILYAYGNSTNDGAVENLEPYTTTGHISTRIIDFSFYVKGAEATFYVDDTQKADVVTVQELREDLEQEIEDRKNAIIDIEHGGTGATTPKEAEFNIIGDTEELTTEINDGAKMYFKQGDPSKTKGSFFVRDSLLFWDYIKRKIKKVLGLDETTYNGNAKTATNLKITVIPENADLDTYTKAGHYVAQTNVFFQNTPYATLRNFSLEVFQLMNEEYMAQRLTVYTTGKVYMRTQTYNENVRVWGEWSRVAFINDTVAKAESLNKTLPIAEGGTGATTASEAEYKMIIPEEITTDLGDNDLVAGIYATPDKNKGVIYKRKGSSIWNYIQGKISSVLGLTKTAYGGKASTAGTADTAKACSGNSATATTATNDSKSQAITSYIRGLSINGKTITYTKGDGTTGTLTTQDTNTTYSAATQSANGLMSASDKKKLDGIATGANAYTHPTTSGNKHIPSGGASGQILGYSADGTAVWKSLDTALSTSSTNPVTNKAIATAINTKLTGKATYKYTAMATNSLYTIEQGDVVLALKLRSMSGSLMHGYTGSGFYVNGVQKTAGTIGSDSIYIFYNNGNTSITLGSTNNSSEVNYLFVKLYG